MCSYSYTGKPLHQHPPLDEFATMLETLFSGTPETPLQPNHLTEEPWTLRELMGAVEKLKLNKSADESGLVAEVFKHIPTNFAAKILGLYNNLLSSGHIPSSWRRTSFTMLAKHRKAALVTDFRPIVSVRLFYKFFPYILLHRIEPCLDSHQPRKNNIVSVLDDAWRNICSPQIYSWIRPCGVDIEFGLVKSF